MRRQGAARLRTWAWHGRFLPIAANRALIAAGYLDGGADLACPGPPARSPGTGPRLKRSLPTTPLRRAGVDDDFRKGASQHNRVLGDPCHGPNPCLAPIKRAPFYAVAIHSGDLGTARGLVTDRHARVLGPPGTPVAGLYAVGNDMHSIMGGTYPGPGITLGPALVFAYLAAGDIARRAGLSAAFPRERAA